MNHCAHWQPCTRNAYKPHGHSHVSTPPPPPPPPPHGENEADCPEECWVKGTTQAAGDKVSSEGTTHIWRHQKAASISTWDRGATRNSSLPEGHGPSHPEATIPEAHPRTTTCDRWTDHAMSKHSNSRTTGSWRGVPRAAVRRHSAVYPACQETDHHVQGYGTRTSHQKGA